MLPIETERLLIRKFSMQDAEDILSFSTDPNIAPYLQDFPGSTIEEIQEYICQQNSYKLGELDHCFDLAVVLKVEDRVIGLLTLISRENKQGELGFASPYQAN
ncbi:MAG: GNAT family N-acetyltransferase [Chloroflexi bacterium]|nr:GNAT family N-acetyltransferase [Chloroflexota bacterium]